MDTLTTDKIEELARRQYEEERARKEAKKQGKSVRTVKKDKKGKSEQKHTSFLKRATKELSLVPISSVSDIVNRQISLYDWQTHHEENVKRERLDWKNPKNSPHVSQTWLVAEGKYYRSEPASTYDRVINNDAPKKEYRRRTDEHKSVVGWAARRMFLETVEFLTTIKKQRIVRKKKERDIVLYSGAAPGHHVNILCGWFRKDFDFVVFDWRKLELTTRENLTIRQESFTDKIAKEYENKGVIFVCNTLVNNGKFDYDEKNIKNAMELQKCWCDVLKPKIALLDFRLPWSRGETEFFEGTIRYPVWGQPSGMDCRIEVVFPKSVDSDGVVTYEKPKIKKYDHKIHEERMFHFNTISRVQLYRHGVHPEGYNKTLDHCYDCMTEIYICQRYIRVSEQKKQVEESRVIPLSELITEYCQKEDPKKSLEVHVPDMTRQRGNRGGHRRNNNNYVGGRGRGRGGYGRNQGGYHRRGGGYGGGNHHNHKRRRQN